MQLFEMQGLLAGKCLPGDMKVNESLAEYLLRQLNQLDELARQVSALQLYQDNIINALGIKGDGPVSKLVIEYVHGLAAENAALKEAVPALQEVSYENDSFDDVSIAEQIGFNEAVRMTTNNMQSTPATDAAIAEIKAQGVDEFAEYIVSSNRTVQNLYCEMQAISYAHDMRKRATDKEIMEVIDSMGGSGNKAARRAANLRAGRKG